jgi:hypothetical protein
MGVCVWWGQSGRRRRSRASCFLCCSFFLLGFPFDGVLDDAGGREGGVQWQAGGVGGQTGWPTPTDTPFGDRRFAARSFLFSVFAFAARPHPCRNPPGAWCDAGVSVEAHERSGCDPRALRTPRARCVHTAGWRRRDCAARPPCSSPSLTSPFSPLSLPRTRIGSLPVGPRGVAEHGRPCCAGWCVCSFFYASLREGAAPPSLARLHRFVSVLATPGSPRGRPEWR